MIFLIQLWTLADALYATLVLCTLFALCQFVVKIIVICADDIKKYNERNHSTAMKAQSTNLGVDLQTNDNTKEILETVKRIEAILDNMQSSLDAQKQQP